MAKRRKSLSRSAERARTLPWEAVLTVGLQVAREARKRWENLTPAEQRRLRAMLTKSKGVPANLSAKERADLRSMVVKAVGFGG